ncbi:hypothetical protein ACFSUS_03595 [Spirosoma soli]|uniref:Uncharacterized protein n=1 Tax=Spirosoma soli TaxID=1770529 RepID=A0ABW5LZI8_9BACT
MKKMTRNTAKQLRSWLLTGLLISSSVMFWNCSGSNKNESGSEAGSTTTADSTEMGRQGDTLNSSSMDAPQQAPPDSASARGAVVPAEVEVKTKKQ